MSFKLIHEFHYTDDWGKKCKVEIADNDGWEFLRISEQSEGDGGCEWNDAEGDEETLRCAIKNLMKERVA